MYKGYPYLYRGYIVDNRDPKNLGRCKINVPSIYGNIEVSKNMLPWARVITDTSVSSKRTSFNVPDIGDIVWLFFEGGDKESPVYIGGTVGVNDIPVNIDEVVFYKEEEDYLIYNRKSREYIIKIEDSKIILKEGENLKIESLRGIDVSSEKDISVEGRNINIKGASGIKLSSDNISILGNTNIEGNTSLLGEFNLTGNLNVTGTVNIVGGLFLNGVPVTP